MALTVLLAKGVRFVVFNLDGEIQVKSLVSSDIRWITAFCAVQMMFDRSCHWTRYGLRFDCIFDNLRNGNCILRMNSLMIKCEDYLSVYDGLEEFIGTPTSQNISFFPSQNFKWGNGCKYCRFGFLMNLHS